MGVADSTQAGLTFRVFIGVEVDSEIRMHLKQSQEWSDRYMQDSSEIRLNRESINGQDYLGFFLKESAPLVDDLIHAEECFENSFAKYFPEIKLESKGIHLFPQVFLS